MAMMTWTRIQGLSWPLFELFIADTSNTHVKISARIHENLTRDL